MSAFDCNDHQGTRLAHVANEQKFVLSLASFEKGICTPTRLLLQGSAASWHRIRPDNTARRHSAVALQHSRAGTLSRLRSMRTFTLTVGPASYLKRCAILGEMAAFFCRCRPLSANSFWQFLKKITFFVEVTQQISRIRRGMSLPTYTWNQSPRTRNEKSL